MKQLKYKPCKVCKTQFKPFSSLAKVCSPHCALKLVRLDNEKAIKRDTRERKKKLKNKSDYTKEAQSDFNRYIRERDKLDSCISCGRYVNDDNLMTGSRWDCGHYLTRGAYPELRFNALNAHKQCTSCNGGSNKYARKNLSVAKQYRINLIEKIGLSKVEWLEGKQEIQHWSIEDLVEIRQYYKDQLKILRGEI